MQSKGKNTFISTKHPISFFYSIDGQGRFPGGSVVKSLPANVEMQVQSLGQEDHLEEEMATHSSILVWEIPWTEETGGLQSMASQRVWHDWVTNTF